MKLQRNLTFWKKWIFIKICLEFLEGLLLRFLDMILFVQKSLENWKYFYSFLRKKIFKEFGQPLRFLKDFPN
jgi:hypothetical protein